MRQKRAKAYRKLMHVYCMSFGFRQPYQVLVDSALCSEAVSSKIDLPKQLSIVLQGSVKPMITQCSIHSLYIAGRVAQSAVDLAKTFERRRCNHKEAIPEEECLKEVIGPANKHRYVLAAQSASLRQLVRQVPGAPIVHVKRSVMVLEPASEATERAKSVAEAERLKPTEAEASTIASTLAESSKSNAEGSAPPRKKVRSPKGPNPLSVKKKKPKESDRQPRSEKPKPGEKRKRDGSDDDDHNDHEQNETTMDHYEPGVSAKRTRKRTRKRKRLAEGQTEDESENGSHSGTWKYGYLLNAYSSLPSLVLPPPLSSAARSSYTD